MRKKLGGEKERERERERGRESDSLTESTTFVAAESIDEQ